MKDLELTIENISEAEVEHWARSTSISHSGRRFTAWDVLGGHFELGDIYDTNDRQVLEKGGMATSDVNNIRNKLIYGHILKRTSGNFNVFDPDLGVSGELVERVSILVSDDDRVRLTSMTDYYNSRFTKDYRFHRAEYDAQREEKVYDDHVNLNGIIQKGEYIPQFEDDAGREYFLNLPFSIYKDPSNGEYVITVDETRYDFGVITRTYAEEKLMQICEQVAAVQIMAQLDVINREVALLSEARERAKILVEMARLMIVIRETTHDHERKYGNNDMEYWHNVPFKRGMTVQIANSYRAQEPSLISKLNGLAEKCEYMKIAVEKDTLPYLNQTHLDQHLIYTVYENRDNMDKTTKEDLVRCKEILNEDILINRAYNSVTRQRDNLLVHERFREYFFKKIIDPALVNERNLNTPIL